MVGVSADSPVVCSRLHGAICMNPTWFAVSDYGIGVGELAMGYGVGSGRGKYSG